MPEFDMRQDNVVASYRKNEGGMIWDLRYWPERSSGEWKTLTLHRPRQKPGQRLRRYDLGWNGKRVSNGIGMRDLNSKYASVGEWLKSTLPTIPASTWEQIEDRYKRGEKEKGNDKCISSQP